MKKIIFIAIFIFTFCAFAFGQSSNCPEVFVTGPPTTVQIGETATFTVSINDSSGYKPERIWSVSSGKIVEGQGTETITVEITDDATLIATVEVKGLPEGCENTASEAAIMCDLRPFPHMLDEFEISSQISLARLNPIISKLENNPTDSVYFIIYTHEKDSSRKLKSREDRIRNYLLKNKIESERLIFVTIGGHEYELDNSLVRIWLVPPGAKPPTP